MSSAGFPAAQEQEIGKRRAAHAALEYVVDGAMVGLGTGSTVKYFLLELRTRLQQGLRIQGVATSRETAEFAKQLQIPLLPDEEEWSLDLAIDGADQVDENLHLIKGGGGALLREKIVAAAAREFVVIVDASKCVPTLGSPVPVPVEVIPFGWPNTARLLRRHGWVGTLRTRNGAVFRTDSGNYILDLVVDRIEDPISIESTLNHIPGVVENGVFAGRANRVIVGSSHGVEVKEARGRT
ncbi:MAG: ribose-5-phosphate isomerase RpiA [Nitrospirae bacterium]|nr:MAG: ribose-5-phosphate isomerase RpiA [Nitrospirota bacterium]